VFHCFTGGPADLERVLAFGASVSFTGVLTYKNAREVRDAAALAPTERIMAETDAPFLSPQAVRKVRPNEPRFVVHVAEQLAHVHGLALEDMHARLNENTERFFGVPAPSAAPLDLAAATA
jgi:TatD DNase family protein